MHQTGEQLLRLMFKDGENVCISPNKYGYHSIPLSEAFNEKVTLLSTTFRDGIEDKATGVVRSVSVEEALKVFPGDEVQLVALNPIDGWREDSNCKAFRNFLIECDYGTREQQLQYIQSLGMPYSAAIFSGGKSIHFLIRLDIDLPNEETWRAVNDWILAIAPLADQNCQNPSRSIRVPGAKRDQNRQELLEYKGIVSFGTLKTWLQGYMHLMPKPKEKFVPSGNPDDLAKIKPWALKALRNGLDPKKGRNKQWFAIACEFAMAGYSEEHAMDILRGYFNPDRTFKEREFLTAVRSGFKHVYEKK